LKANSRALGENRVTKVQKPAKEKRKENVMKDMLASTSKRGKTGGRAKKKKGADQSGKKKKKAEKGEKRKRRGTTKGVV